MNSDNNNNNNKKHAKLLSLLKSYQNIPDIFALEHDHTDTDFTQFLIACSQGQVDKVHNILHYHPYYLNINLETSTFGIIISTIPNLIILLSIYKQKY